MTGEGRKNRVVCFIAGAGHSGSTLVGMVLGSHPDCFYAGEASKTRFLGNPRKELRKRTCKICGEACPVWGGFVVAEEPDLYEQIARRTGASVIVDSTKNIDWITARAAEASAGGAALRLVVLRRDGRAVINSRVRKYPDRDPREHIEGWIEQVRRTQAFYDTFAHPKVIVRYEEFSLAPAAVSQRLCDFVGLDYRPDMLEFTRHDHHPLGGNSGTQYLVARAHGGGQAGPVAGLGDRSREYYEHHADGISLDLRWQRELRAEVLDLFERLAGDVNAPMRWESEHGSPHEQD
jgi:hypothetical protein